MTEAAPEDQARALARLDETGAAIVAGIERQVPGWVRAQVERLLDAWGRAPAHARRVSNVIGRHHKRESLRWSAGAARPK